MTATAARYVPEPHEVLTTEVLARWFKKCPRTVENTALEALIATPLVCRRLHAPRRNPP